MMTGTSGEMCALLPHIWCSKLRRKNFEPKLNERLRPECSRRILMPIWAPQMLPDLLGLHLRLALEYGVFPVLPRRITFASDPARYQALIEELDRWRLPVLDEMRGTLPVAREEVEDAYRRVLEHLNPGITHFALHCTTPDGSEGIAREHAYWRINEYQLFCTGAVGRWCDAAGLARTGLRDLQELWQSASAD